VLAEARIHQMPVLCYTVNQPESAKALFGRGVSSLFTDRLDLFSVETNHYKALHFGG
jgi:glycerophosphoryl diester phosphodiesterase